jgi:hypothetical protein
VSIKKTTNILTIALHQCLSNPNKAGTKMTPQLTNHTALLNLTPKETPSKTNFEEALTNAIDEVFTALGENVKRATYNYVENKYATTKEQIPRQIENFTAAIETIFGEAAWLVELRVMEKLQGKAQGFIYRSKCEEIFFVDYLAALKRYID